MTEAELMMLRDAAYLDRVDTLRAVADGKIDALYREAKRLAIRTLLGRILMADAADILHDAALANGLYDAFGVDQIQELMAAAFDDATVTVGAFATEQQEVAA